MQETVCQTSFSIERVLMTKQCMCHPSVSPHLVSTHLDPFPYLAPAALASSLNSGCMPCLPSLGSFICITTSPPECFVFCTSCGSFFSCCKSPLNCYFLAVFLTTPILYPQALHHITVLNFLHSLYCYLKFHYIYIKMFVFSFVLRCQRI